MPRKLILRSWLALGDTVCMTAAIRELHRQYPGEYLTDVRTPFSDVWANNPDITPISDEEGELVWVHYDRDKWESVNRSNQHPTHLITAYCQDLGNSLGITLRPQELKGHVYLSRDEYSTKSIPHELFNVQRFWLLNAGHKNDFTVKQWPAETFQAVVNYFKGKIQFVQVGHVGSGHWHPALEGTINLVGKTSVRQLIQLVHSSCGVLTGISALMHLTTAVPVPHWQRRNRPCVVVAGGREPRTWYGYPTHRVLETVGSLSCCRDGGCWHARVVALNDGQDSDKRLCERVINSVPKCMQMIRPEQVILAIEQYLDSEGIE